MQRHKLAFRHETIDPNAPSERLVFCEPVDLTGNGYQDVIIGGKGAPDNLHIFGVGTTYPNYRRRLRELVGQRESNLFWYENTGEDWIRHDMADVSDLEVGAALVDVDGDGRVDLVAGRSVHHDEVYWFRQPADPREEWTERVLTDKFEMYHDLGVADVNDDGDPEVVGLSQKAEAVFYYDIPEDPTVEPWPRENCTLVADVDVEGLEIVDIDGDGRTEIIAGTNVFHREDATGERWRRDTVLTGWDPVRVAVADLDGDGDLEIVYAEGDSPAHGTHPARVAWVDPHGDRRPEILRDEMFCPHSLEVADLTGDGRPDIYVGEMGLGENDPEHVAFINCGDGTFEPHVVATGIPTHEAKLVDVDGDGSLDVVGKSFKPDAHVDVWYRTD